MITKFGSIMMFAFLMLAFVSCAKTSVRNGVPADIDEAVDALSDAINRSGQISFQIALRIDSVKSDLAEMRSVGDSLRLLTELSDIYTHFQVDSFFKYSNLAIGCAKKLGDIESATCLELKRTASYPLKLHFNEAVNSLSAISPDSLSLENKRVYYEAGKRIYLYFTTVHSSGSVYGDYMSEFASYNDALVSLVPQDDPYYKLYLGVQYLCRDELALCIAVLSEQISDMDILDEKFSEVASMLSLAYYLRDRYKMWMFYMTLAAISETELAVRDGEATRRMASAYYNIGEHDYAYRLMIESEKNVAASGAIMRSVHISEDVPMISGAYIRSQSASVVRLSLIIVCLLALSALAIVMLYSKQRDRKRLAKMAHRLEQANITKGVYISQFLSLCSTYVDKMEDFNKLVSRKLVAGQIDELFYLTKTDKIVNEQRKLFYDIFDEAFMRIYPTFIQDVNKLLAADKQFQVDGEHLSPELRILAFMRLGLDDSSQMARFLGLSVNTVYTYRNRIKTRALNRDTFEKDIAVIGNPIS